MKSAARIVALTIALASSCTCSHAQVVEPLTPDSSLREREGKAVVLMDINWSRRWKCAGFENAQIRSLAFDRMPVAKSADDEPSDLAIEDPSPLTGKPGFVTYGFVVDPGEYALTGMKIKVARSVSDVGFFEAKRTSLLKADQPLAGSFEARAGELVYIGHFFLDCNQRPTLWRYYLKDRSAFNEYVEDVKKKYPALSARNPQFRLFRTTMLGEPFELPK